MRILEQVLEANREFVTHLPKEFIDYCPLAGKFPSKELAIFTCMDTRLVDFLEPAMGIARGEAKVIKNAGNTITTPFDPTIRSLLIGIFELGVKEVVVIGHMDCGMASTDSQELIACMLERGISKDAIKMVEKELEEWIDHFHHPRENVEEAVLKIRSNPLIPKDVPIHGLLFHPHSGALQVVINGYECQKRDAIGDAVL